MLLSIVTINYNNQSGLRDTLESVASQSFKAFDYVIIDGNSSDGSMEVVGQYSDIVSDFISEPDNGIYNAMNKGLSLAKGDYLLFLNSGDTFLNASVVEWVMPQLQGEDILYGDLEVFTPEKRWLKKYNENISFGYFIRDTLPHQASFIKKDMLIKCGGFDESLRMASDWKFFLEAVCRQSAKIKYLARVISCYDYTGISSVKENQVKLMLEKDTVLRKEYPLFYWDYDNVIAFNTLAKKYRTIISSRWVRCYLRVRNLFSAIKIEIDTR